MLGEGMPWHIIMVFFALGAIIGIMNGIKQKKVRSSSSLSQNSNEQ